MSKAFDKDKFLEEYLDKPIEDSFPEPKNWEFTPEEREALIELAKQWQKNHNDRT